MSNLTPSTKAIILELHINSNRVTLHLIEQVARVLDTDIGEHDEREWVQLIHLRHINKEKSDAR